MHRFLLSAASAILFLFVAAPVAAENSGGSDEAAIRQLLNDWVKAVHNRDIAGIMAMYNEKAGVTAYDIVPPLQYDGYTAYKKDYEDFLAQFKGPVDFSFHDLTVVTGGDVAFAYGLEHQNGVLADGSKSDVWMRVTSCFRKIDGRWFDVHDHVSVPADFATGKAMLALTP